MNLRIQSGMHPDAESLTAFAEQLLPAAERNQILAHMATCNRCREVVFLAQRAAGEHGPARVPEPASGADVPERRWFATWRWAWVPVLALAGFVGVAVVQHFRRVAQPEPQMTSKIAPPTNALRRAEPAPAASTSAPSPTTVQQAKEKARASMPKATPRAVQKDAAKQLDDKKQVQEREEEAAAGGAGTASGVIGGLAGGSVHGMATARAKSQSLGGPMAANQFQQNANQLQQQNLARQDALQASQYAQPYNANKPMTIDAAPAAAAETVTVESQAEIAPVPAAPVPPMTLSVVTNQSVDLAGRKAMGLKKNAKIALPSGAGVLSSASAGGYTVALDTAGALFVSEDNQKHWQPVQAQWTGRAVLVRTRQVTTQSADNFAFVQAPRFELVTDKLQTWVSADGKTWAANPLTPK